MATRKAGGSTQLGRDSISKRLGVKIFGNQKVAAGNIIVRQRGSKFHAGKNVRRCGDDTLMALVNGYVSFSVRKTKNFTGKLVKRRYVNVVEKVEKKEVKKAAPKSEKKIVKKAVKKIAKKK